MRADSPAAGKETSKMGVFASGDYEAEFRLDQ
jgi:hypothetical protein